MNITLTPYETCFRVEVDGKKTPATIEFMPVGIPIDVEEESCHAAYVLCETGIIPEDQYLEAQQQIVNLLDK